MMKKITPVFGPQEMFNGAPDNAVIAIKQPALSGAREEETHFFSSAYDAVVKAVTSFNFNHHILNRMEYAERRIDETHISDTSDKEIEDLISDRDLWESKATELAHSIAEKFGTDFGEHSSANCPVQNAIDFVFDLESTERIIDEPKRWTVADQKAGRLPEIGTVHAFCGLTGEFVCRFIDFKGDIWSSSAIGEMYSSGDYEASPIETPDEYAERLESEFIDSMVKELKVNIGSVSYQIVRSAIRHSYRKLSGDLPPVQAKDGA